MNLLPYTEEVDKVLKNYHCIMKQTKICPIIVCYFSKNILLHKILVRVVQRFFFKLDFLFIL